MRHSFDAYKFARKTSLYVVLVFVIVFTFYYSYGFVIDFFLPSQTVSYGIDPLDDLGNSPKPIESIDAPSFQESQSSISDVQKDKMLSIIKANQKISDSKKAQIMRELGGNIK